MNFWLGEMELGVELTVPDLVYVFYLFLVLVVQSLPLPGAH
jgi:hypothetical protein